MNAFQKASVVGEIAEEKAIRLFRDRSYNGQIVTTFKGRLSKELQKSAGDLLFNRKASPDQLVCVEVKGEDNYTGNFFLEYWSNLKRLTPGWMFTLRSDLLCYVFNDVERAFVISLPELQRWAFVAGRIYLYELKQMKKYVQMNDTWGRCVPIHVIRRDVGLIEWDLIQWQQIP